MRVNSVLAQLAVKNRGSFVIEAAMSLGIEASWDLAMKFGSKGYHIPSNSKLPSSDQIKKILSGRYDCPAYLAQACFDALVVKGYEPIDDIQQLKLIAAMLLTRSSVKSLPDAIKLIPTNWNDLVKQKIENCMSEGV